MRIKSEQIILVIYGLITGAILYLLHGLIYSADVLMAFYPKYNTAYFFGSVIRIALTVLIAHIAVKKIKNKPAFEFLYIAVGVVLGAVVFGNLPYLLLSDDSIENGRKNLLNPAEFENIKFMFYSIANAILCYECAYRMGKKYLDKIHKMPAYVYGAVASLLIYSVYPSLCFGVMPKNIFANNLISSGFNMPELMNGVTKNIIIAAIGVVFLAVAAVALVPRIKDKTITGWRDIFVGGIIGTVIFYIALIVIRNSELFGYYSDNFSGFMGLYKLRIFCYVMMYVLFFETVISIGHLGTYIFWHRFIDN